MKLKTLGTTISYEKSFRRLAKEIGLENNVIRKGKRLYFEIPEEADRKTVKKAVANNIIVYYKSKIILEELKAIEEKTFLAALSASVTSFRLSEEKELIYEKINTLAEVNIDGMVDFRLSELTAEWKELGKLIIRLYTQCDSIAELYELTRFMLTLEAPIKQNVEITEDLKIIAGETVTEPYEIFSETDYDLIFSTIFFRPGSVIIKEPEKTPSSVVIFIKGLGNG